MMMPEDTTMIKILKEETIMMVLKDDTYDDGTKG